MILENLMNYCRQLGEVLRDGIFPGGGFFRGRIFLGKEFSGGVFSGENFPRGRISQGEFSLGDFTWEEIPWEFFPGGSFSRTDLDLSYWKKVFRFALSASHIVGTSSGDTIQKVSFRETLVRWAYVDIPSSKEIQQRVTLIFTLLS